MDNILYDFLLFILLAGAFCSMIGLSILIFILRRAEKEEINKIIRRFENNE